MRHIASTFAIALVAICLVVVVAAEDEASERQARINAQPLADGRIEFAVQLEDMQCVGSGSEEDLMEEESCSRLERVWGQRILPRVRKFPAEPPIDRWHSSSPSISVGEVETRIRVRRLDDGRTEFALQQKADGENWGEHILPSGRFLSASHRTSHIDRWLNSSVVRLSTEIAIPTVVVPAGVPVVASSVLLSLEADLSTPYGTEIYFAYGVSEDPLYQTYYTVVAKRTRTDSDEYPALFLQIGCHHGEIDVAVYDLSIPYHSGERVRVSYRVDDGDLVTEDWQKVTRTHTGIVPSDPKSLLRILQSADTLVLRAWFSGGTVTGTFARVNQMFRTRVQPNIEYCGHY